LTALEQFDLLSKRETFMKTHRRKTKKKLKLSSQIFSASGGFYLAFAACIIIFVALLFALPHWIPKPLTPNQLRQQKAAQGLHAQGNKLLNGLGQQVTLHGVDRSGTEYQCVHDSGKIFDGPDDATSIQAMKSWHINSVRIPLNEDCWLGINDATPSGQLYQQAIIQYVDEINKQHMFAIVDLHWNAPGTDKATGQQVMADKDHSLAFWDSVAQTFKNNPAIIFDLYNEPRNISWSCWKDGTGCETDFPVASMQDMINTVRATGANNVLMLGGLDFANDLSGWLRTDQLIRSIIWLLHCIFMARINVIPKSVGIKMLLRLWHKFRSLQENLEKVTIVPSAGQRRQMNS
jgi:hypothetical protein